MAAKRRLKAAGTNAVGGVKKPKLEFFNNPLYCPEYQSSPFSVLLSSAATCSKSSFDAPHNGQTQSAGRILKIRSLRHTMLGVTDLRAVLIAAQLTRIHAHSYPPPSHLRILSAPMRGNALYDITTIGACQVVSVSPAKFSYLPKPFRGTSGIFLQFHRRFPCPAPRAAGRF